MPKPATDHTQEFIKALKEELKKDKPPKDPRIEHIMEKQRAKGRSLPPEMILSRLSHINRRNRGGEEETWLSMARTVYEMWETENYPDEVVPPVP